MSHHEYRAAIAALGLSQVKAAYFLGIGTRTSRHYALGESPVPKAIAMLLNVMVKYGLHPEDMS